MQYWLGLVVGNSRLHWAFFKGNILQEAWNTSHISQEITSSHSLSKILPKQYQSIICNNPITIYLASVVAAQTALWRNYPHLKYITLADISLANMYSSLGIDRALNLYGAGETYGYPCLVVDGGTALTFTGVDRNKVFQGGAILAGLRSHFTSLHQQTAALPLINISASLPPRWALDTEQAIFSGIIYTSIAGVYSYIRDWLAQFPDSSIVFTGGDGELLCSYLQTLYPEIIKPVIVDQNVVFWGIRALFYG